MATNKVAITLNKELLKRVDRLVVEKHYPSRSRIIQVAVEEKLARIERGRLAREAAKLNKRFEQKLADEGLTGDAAEWPEY